MKRLFSFLLIPLIFCGCAKKNETRRFFALDTQITVTAPKDACEKTYELCRKYEKIFSRTDPESELYLINSGAKKTAGEDIRALLSLCEKMYNITGGAFDCTLGALSDLWNIKERTVPPTKEEIASALNKTGFDKISLSPLSLGGTQLDFGACAKGYIADKAADALYKSGVKKAILDLGGNVYVLGTARVGVRDPQSPDKLFCRFTLKDKSAVTSGSYQRFFEYGGVRYHHILDPKTGECAQSGGSVSSVTVISPSSAAADCLSTAIFVTGEKGLELCRAFPDTDALIITNKRTVLTTDGFKKKYSLEILD